MDNLFNDLTVWKLIRAQYPSLRDKEEIDFFLLIKDLARPPINISQCSFLLPISLTIGQCLEKEAFITPYSFSVRT